MDEDSWLANEPCDSSVKERSLSTTKCGSSVGSAFIMALLFAVLVVYLTREQECQELFHQAVQLIKMRVTSMVAAAIHPRQRDDDVPAVVETISTLAGPSAFVQ